MKFSLQMLVSKLLPWFFHGPAILGVQNASLRYRDLMAQVEANAARYQLAAYAAGVAGAAWMALKQKNVLGALLSLLAPAALIKLTYEPTPKQLRLDSK